ncbi:MAG TPA: hypothetical protein VMW93_09030, partial [bacterium]|nr:hypothetical protein [bacterium]
MKVLLALVLATAPTAMAGVWVEYEPPEGGGVNAWIGGLAVNQAGLGYATCPRTGGGDFLKLENGEWQLLGQPPVFPVHLSITADGTLYAMDSHGSGNIWRYSATGCWACVLTPGGVGAVKFKGVAGVGPDEFWALGSNRDARAIVAYYRNGGVAQIYDLGRYRTDPNLSTLGHIVAPRAENPGAEAYVALQTLENEIWPAKWVLAVLKPDGRYSFYPIPRGDEEFHVEGLVA